MAGPGGIRNFVNGNPAVAGGVIAAIILVAVGIWYFTATPTGHGKMYFTMDDGKTYFPGPARATPYTKGGKEVDQALVFICDGKEFVGYLRRYPPKVKAQVDRQLAQPQTGLIPPGEIKRPGDSQWVPEPGAGPAAAVASPAANAGDLLKEAMAIQIVTCPDGKRALLHLPN